MKHEPSLTLSDLRTYFMTLYVEGDFNRLQPYQNSCKWTHLKTQTVGRAPCCNSVQSQLNWRIRTKQKCIAQRESCESLPRSEENSHFVIFLWLHLGLQAQMVLCCCTALIRAPKSQNLRMCCANLSFHSLISIATEKTIVVKIWMEFWP